MKLGFLLISGALLAQSALAAPLCTVRSPAPAMTLVGESHEDLNINSIEGEDLDQSRAGKVIIAQEGWVAGNAIDEEQWPKLLELTHSQVVGIEEDRSYSVTLFLANVLKYHTAMIALVKAFQDKDALGMVTNSLSARKQRKYIIELLNQYSYTKKLYSSFAWPPSTLNGDDAPKSAEEILNWMDEEAKWGTAFIGFTKVVAESLTDNPPVPGYDPKIFTAGSAPGASCTQAMLAMKKIYIEWRNRYLAQNIARAYCDSAPQGKGVTAIVGALHLPGLHRLLNGLLPANVHIEERNFAELDRTAGLDCPGDDQSAQNP